MKICQGRKKWSDLTTAKFGRELIKVVKRPNCDYLASENDEGRWSALLHNDGGTKYERGGT